MREKYGCTLVNTAPLSEKELAHLENPFNDKGREVSMIEAYTRHGGSVNKELEGYLKHYVEAVGIKVA